MLLDLRCPAPHILYWDRPAPCGLLGRPTARRKSWFSVSARQAGHTCKGPLRVRPCSCTPAKSPALSTVGDGSSPGTETRERPRLSRVEELAATEIGPGTGLSPFHLAAFFIVLGAGLWFLAVLLYFTADIQLQQACLKVVRRLLKTVALRQVIGILAAMTFVRFGLEPLVKTLRRLFVAPGTWEKSSEYYILREVYRPLEFLFSVAAITTLAENFLPQLIALPKGLVQNFVRSTLSLTFVISAARVVFNIKARMTRETTWNLELKGELTKQRRVEAVDKLMTVLTLLVASVFGLQAIGLDVNSVLAIGGVGGLAVGLAGREILENLFTGLIILSSSPFEVGDEVLFAPPTGSIVEGIVIDVGWYRTTIRSFEREIYNIPNSVFSRNVVLNITRKQREWRFYEFIGIRVMDVNKVGMVVADMRKIIRQDPRIIQKLHRRVFLDKVTREQVSIYVSCYVEAANRDAFMAVKQDLLLAFVDCVERNGARLAQQRIQLEVSAAPGPAAISSRSSASEKVGGEASPKALPEGAEQGRPSSSVANDSPPSASDAAGGVAAPNGERKSAKSGGKVGSASSSSSSNKPPPVSRESVVAAAISVASALSSEDQSPDSSKQGSQVGSWITASFDELPS